MKEWTPEQIKDFRKRLNLYQKDFIEQEFKRKGEETWQR